jgi:hypothetical protein
MDELSKLLDQEESQLESILNPKEKVQGPREGVPQIGELDGKAILRTGGRSPGTRLSSGLTKRELRGLARQIRLAEGNPDKILDALYATRATKVAKGDPTLMQKIIGYRMNAMLSGPKTLVNQRCEQRDGCAAASGGVLVGWCALWQQGSAVDGSDMLVGLGTELGDSFRAGWKSFVAGENMLDKSKHGLRGSDRGACRQGR